MADQRKLARAATHVPASEYVIDEFVETLRGLCSTATLALALRVGRLVVDTFYEGDLALWRACGKGHPSLRCLAKRQDLPMSAPRLYRCVAIYELSQRLPRVSTWKHLGSSHVRIVLGLPENEQEPLLELAELKKWTVQRLESEARRFRGAGVQRRGRPPQSEGSKRLSSIKRWLDECPDSLPTIDPRSIDYETLTALHARVRAVGNKCDEIEATIRRHLPHVAGAKAALGVRK